MTRTTLAALLLAIAPAACAAPAVRVAGVQAGADSGLFDAAGYRTARFRAPVDRVPTPAYTLSLDAALQFAPGRDAVFVDVLPVEGGWRDPETGAWRLSVPHQTVPGALWHPETGRTDVEPLLWQGLVDAVARARAVRADLPVVVFCRADCWMGWNAARRLAQEGIGEVYWLPEGTDGWHDRGAALVSAQPVAIAPER